MRKLKLFMTALALTGGVNAALAQTDVTSQYLTNADFSQGTPIDNDLCGYGKDMAEKGTTYYGFQQVTGWTSVVTAADNSNATYPNSGMGGAVFAYGSTFQLKGNNVAAPATNPGGEATGNALGFFAVWGCGGYYYQDVTFPAGKYTLTFPIYCQSGTQANETYTGFFPTSGTNRTVAINTTVGSWVNQTVSFTLTAETAGQIRIGYKSIGGGSSANPHLFFDGVKIEFTAQVVKDVLENAIAAATKANATLNNADLTSAISTAQSVYDNTNATQEEVNSAAATLNAATELAMSAAGDVTAIFLTNADFSTTDGWTLSASSQYHDQGNYQIGGSEMVRFAAPSADETHLTSEKAFGFEVRWQTNYTQYYQTTDPVPAGVYTFTFDVENVNGSTTKATYNNLFYAQVGSNKVTDSSTEWMDGKSSWTTHTIRITVEEAAPLTISLGYGTGSNNFGADNTPALYVSHLSLTYKSFLAGAKEAWDEAVAAAGEAKTNNPNVTGEELAALDAELAKAEPNTVDGYNAATEALTTATTALTSAAASYNALAAVNGMITAAGELQYADQTKKPSADVTATSAADANTKTTSQYTALRAYYESNAKAEGVEEAMDYASAISAANADTNTGWTNGVGTNRGQGYTDSEGTVAALYLDGGWASNAPCNVDMTRTVEVPAGKYLLTVKARGAVELTEYTLSIAGQTINLPHSNGGSNGVFGNGWDDASVEFESDGTAQTLEVIAKSTASQQWFSMNDFRLVQLKLNSDVYASTEDYAAMNAAIAEAEAKTLGFEDGEYAPYANVEALKALAEAKAIDQTAELTNFKSTVAALTETLTNATWTANDGDVDAIYNGLFATVTEGANYPDGWARTNGWGQMQSGLSGDYATAYYNQPGSLKYGDTGVYTMPLAANTAYRLTFAYRSHENNSNNGVTVSVLNGEEGLAATTFEANGSTSEWKVATKVFNTGAAGNYVLTLANGGNTWMTGVSLVKAVPEDVTIDEAANEAPAANDFANVTLTRTLKGGIWNTFSVPFDAAIPEGWTVKEFTSAEENTLNFTAANSIVAGVPYLVKTSADVVNPTFEGVAVQATEGETVGETDYKFAAQIYNKGLAYDGTVAYLSTDGTIKKLASGGIKGLRAYFIIPANANPEAPARIAFVDEGGTTAIESVASETVNAENGIYDLQGRRVNAAKKGLYIINGKKVVK